MLKGLSFKNRQDGIKFKYTVKIECLKLCQNMPWHSEKVWYHPSARQCATISEEMRILCINFRRGSKDMYTKHAAVTDSVLEQVFLPPK